MRTEIIIEREDVVTHIRDGRFDECDIAEFVKAYINKHDEEHHASRIADLMDELNNMLHAEWSGEYGSLTNI